MILVDLRKHASEQGAVAARDAGHRAASTGRRPGDRLLESPRLRAEPFLQRLRLGRDLRALRRAHDLAPRARRSCAAITAVRMQGARPFAAIAASLSIRSARGPSASRKRWRGCFRMRRWPGWTGIRRRARGAMRGGARAGAQRRGAHPGRHADAHQGASFSGRQHWW